MASQSDDRFQPPIVQSPRHMIEKNEASAFWERQLSGRDSNMICCAAASRLRSQDGILVRVFKQSVSCFAFETGEVRHVDFRIFGTDNTTDVTFTGDVGAPPNLAG